MSFAAYDASKLLAIAATGVAGIMTGCLTFVSAVDARSFLAHLDKKETSLIQQHFPIWWPNGRDLMVSLILTATLAHGGAYYTSVARNRNNWAISGFLLMMIGPYTAIVLGEDIETLRKADSKEVATTARRFCNLHHVRLVLAVAGFGLSLISLAEV